MKKNKNYTLSSGNVFADLEYANPEELLAKAELTYQINSLIDQRNITQIAAAELLEIDQSKITSLRKGRLSDFSLERLLKFLNVLKETIRSI